MSRLSRHSAEELKWLRESYNANVAHYTKLVQNVAHYTKLVQEVDAEIASREPKPGDRVRIVSGTGVIAATGVLLNPEDSWIKLIRHATEVTQWVLRDNSQGILFGVDATLYHLEKIEP